MLESLSVGETILAKVFDIIEQQKKKTQPVQQLAGDRGLPAAPTTASGTGALGGTPQQQAMAGTPAQKKSVFQAVTKVAAPQGETAFEQAKLLRAPVKETESDIASKQKVQQMIAGMGTFGAKAVELVDRAMGAVAAPAEGATEPPTDVTIDTVLTSIPEASRAAVDVILKRLPNETGSARLESLAALNRLLGKTPGEPLDAAAVEKLYNRDVAKTVSAAAEGKFEAAAAGEDRKLTVADFNALGSSAEEVASILGLTTDEVNNLTISQLQDALASAELGLGAVETTTAGMASSLLSSTERAALKDYLVQLEERGLAGSATQYDSLLRDIDAGTTVSVGGKNYSIEELLADGAFSAIAAQYLADPTSDWAKKLAASEPEFVKYLTANADNLKALISAAGTSATELGELQKARAAQFEGLDAATVKALTGIDLGEFATAAITAEDIAKYPPAVQAVINAPAAAKKTMGSNLAILNSVLGPEAVKGYDAATIQEMGLDRQDSPGVAWANEVKRIRAMKAEKNPEMMLDAITDGTLDIEDVNAQLNEDNIRRSLGLPVSSLGELDTDGQPGLSEAELAAGVEARYKEPSFGDFRSGAYKGPEKLSTIPPPLEPDQQALVAAGKDKVITAEEVAKVGTDVIAQLATAAAEPFKKSLTDIVERRVNEEAAPAINSYNSVVGLDLSPGEGSRALKFNRLDTAMGQLQKVRSDLETILASSISAAAKARITPMLATVNGQIAQVENTRNSIPKEQIDEVGAIMAKKPADAGVGGLVSSTLSKVTPGNISTAFKKQRW